MSIRMHIFNPGVFVCERYYVHFREEGGVKHQSVPSLSSLPSPAGRQVSQRLAEEAKKRERFEELKQHLEQEQEVVNVRVCGSV